MIHNNNKSERLSSDIEAPVHIFQTIMFELITWTYSYNKFGLTMVFEFVNGCACVRQKFAINGTFGFDELFGHTAVTSLG